MVRPLLHGRVRPPGLHDGLLAESPGNRRTGLGRRQQSQRRTLAGRPKGLHPPNYFAENRTRTPPLNRRGVPVVDGFVCTNDTWLNMFWMPKNTSTLRPTPRMAVRSADA